VGAEPDEANRRFLERERRPRQPVQAAAAPDDLDELPRTDVLRQFSTIARRQVRLVVSDRGYTVFLAVLPFLVGALSLAAKGAKPGLGPASPTAPSQPQHILVLLNFGAVFMGTALSIRDLVGERPIFQREQAVGLSTRAYLLAKVCVFAAFATVEAAIATAIAIAGKGRPTAQALFLGNSSFELFVTVAATCVVSTILGMVLSAFAQSNEQIMPMLVVTIMSQLVLSGGLIAVTGRLGINQLAWLTPARSGYAAAASTVDFSNLVHLRHLPNDSHWKHTRGAWLFDMAMLAALSVIYSGIVWWRIRLKR
jgi:hypothetical protein